MKRIYLLYNPKSGRETVTDALSDLIEELTVGGFEIVVRPTLYSGEATKLAEALPGDYDALICCGGDGTLNEVVTGVLKRKSPLRIGYIPFGSTNDFGHTIYGSLNHKDAVSRIMKLTPHDIDCGLLEGKPFVYTAAFGLFTDISYETPHNVKAALGHAAYVLEAVRNLSNIKVYKVRTEIDGDEVIEGSYLIGMVTNADYVGGLQNITGKNINLQDGELELTMIANPEKPSDFGKVLQALYEGIENESVIRRKVKHVRFTFDSPTPFTTDGEYGGTYETADVRCLPGAVTMVF